MADFYNDKKRVRMVNVIALAYGDSEEYRRVALCLLSFWAWYSDDLSKVRLILYTDNLSFFDLYFQGINVECKCLTPEKWEKMLNGYTYKFHRKISLIEECLITHPNDNLLFLDADTFSIQDPALLVQSIAPGKSYMHLMDFVFGEGNPFETKERSDAFLKWLETKKFRIGSEIHYFNKRHVSWNSGVIGISSNILPYMSDVTQITEDIYREAQFHISEQLAFALVLQVISQINPSDSVFLHYWQNKALPLSALSEKIDARLARLSNHKKRKLIRWCTLYLKYVYMSTISFNSNKVYDGYSYALKAMMIGIVNKAGLLNQTHLIKVIGYNTLKRMKLIQAQ